MSMSKLSFRTQYDRVRTVTESGDPVHILYSPEYDKEGHMELVETGRENIYDYIQSHKDSTDINLILQRFAKGDSSALSRRQGMFGDFTQLPKNYADMLNQLNRAEGYFNSLPVEERARFNHSFPEFVAALGDLAPASPVEKPVVTDQSVDVSAAVKETPNE